MSGPRDGLACASEEQLRYARVLGWGTRIGLGLLVASFVAYVFGWLPPLVPHEQLARLWTKPVGEYLAVTGMPTGWSWFSLVGRGDIANLVGIGVLAGVSVPCLAAVIPAYAARRDTVFLVICVLEIGVLLLAASGILTAGH